MEKVKAHEKDKIYLGNFFKRFLADFLFVVLNFPHNI